MKLSVKITCLFFLGYACSFGQKNSYDYKRELPGIKDQWYRIILPNDIFNKVAPDFSDVRIYGITGTKDTIEAPYILRQSAEKAEGKEVAFHLINQSKNGKGYYYTFDLPTEIVVNQIKLAFRQTNFDWRVSLEGSQNQREWFSIIDHYRILSIKNDRTAFQFTDVIFPGSRYHFFRMLIQAGQKPELISAKISRNDVSDGDYRTYTTQAVQIRDEKRDKQTIVEVDLKSIVPVSKLGINIKDKFDYYRSVTIQYLADSVKTPQGWRYEYNTLTSGTVNSFGKNEFRFNGTLLRKLKMIIENEDNAPLHIDSVVVKGYIHELIVRFDTPGTYFLTYGNRHASKPNYDIERFTDKIPNSPEVLKLGDEQSMGNEIIQKAHPLFQSKIWLWVVMVIVIGVLGWFSFSMLKK
jgi:hypothetical protein